MLDTAPGDDPTSRFQSFIAAGTLLRVVVGGAEILGRITASGPEHVVLATGRRPEDSRVVFVDEVSRIQVLGGSGPGGVPAPVLAAR